MVSYSDNMCSKDPIILTDEQKKPYFEANVKTLYEYAGDCNKWYKPSYNKGEWAKILFSCNEKKPDEPYLYVRIYDTPPSECGSTKAKIGYQWHPKNYSTDQTFKPHTLEELKAKGWEEAFANCLPDPFGDPTKPRRYLAYERHFLPVGALGVGIGLLVFFICLACCGCCCTIACIYFIVTKVCKKKKRKRRRVQKSDGSVSESYSSFEDSDEGGELESGYHRYQENQTHTPLL